MDLKEAMNADQPLPPKIHRLSTSANEGGMRKILQAPTIALMTYLAGWYLELDQNFGSGVLTATSFITATELTTSGSSGERSIFSLVMQGLLWQLACYHFEMSGIVRMGYALSTCFSVYVTANRSSNIGESRTERSCFSNHDANDEHTTTVSNNNALNKITIFTVVATLVFIIIVAMNSSASQLSAKNCMSSVHRIDHTHWEAIVYERDLSGRGCNAAAQMALAESEMRVYTRSLREEACSVSCIKRNYAGYWTAYVSVTPPGSPVDGTYCGDAYSYGDCGKGLVRQRVGSL